jgi:HAD superfamily hydrolase (TIGR01509 family)
MGDTFFKAKAILLDLNGVLADSRSALFGSYQDFLQQFGAEGSEEEYDAHLNGPTDREKINYLKGAYNLQQELTDLDEFFFLLAKKRYDETVSLLPGALELLKHFKSLNFTLGLVTSSPIEVIEVFLTKNGFKGYFEEIITGDNISTGKPSPEIYINALNRLNASATSVFVFEGSKNGIISAYKAGVMKIVGIGPKDIHSELMKAGAMAAMENLRELIALPWELER